MSSRYTFQVNIPFYSYKEGVLCPSCSSTFFTLNSRSLKEVFRYLNRNRYFVELLNISGDVVDYLDKDVDISKPITIRDNVATVCIEL